ncbi:hypothetical protein [Streptomyces sp. NPDC005970]|uniref:hypothetical protein n=1 Tax=Streptomyces sp. NPDC005970 TaxID=3156723 RepID=UPI0033D4123E
METDSSPPRQRVRLCDSQGRKTTLPYVGERHLPVEPAETQLATLDDLTDLTAHHPQTGDQDGELLIGKPFNHPALGQAPQVVSP